MKYRVLRGFVRHNGALFRKGSVFDADEADVRALIRKGVVAPAEIKAAKSDRMDPEDPTDTDGGHPGTNEERLPAFDANELIVEADDDSPRRRTKRRIAELEKSQSLGNLDGEDDGEL
jgi:hypothetical protein